MLSPAQQAQAELGSLNRKIIEEIPAKMLKAGPPIRIFNVGPWSWIRPMGSWGTFTIPACPAGKKHSIALDVPYLAHETYPDAESTNKMRNRFEDGADLALAILGEGPFQSKDHGFSRFGVFIAAGDTPTEEELDAAKAKLTQWYESQVAEADNFWNAGPMQYQNIVKEHREAAIALGQEREWLKPLKQTIECPGCGARVNPNIAVHAVQQGGCGAIINEERYKKLQWAGEPRSSSPQWSASVPQK